MLNPAGPLRVGKTFKGACYVGNNQHGNHNTGAKMPNPTIPDESVEAAAKAIRAAVDPTQAAIVGPYVASEMQARAALEAAAPYMLAGAWNEGHGAGQLDPYCLNGNPYDPRDRPAP